MLGKDKDKSKSTIIEQAHLRKLLYSYELFGKLNVETVSAITVLIPYNIKTFTQLNYYVNELSVGRNCVMVVNP